MSRPLTQLLPADLSVGGTTESGPQVTSMNNLKTLLQLPVKSDQEGSKDCCQVKGEHLPPLHPLHHHLLLPLRHLPLLLHHLPLHPLYPLLLFSFRQTRVM